jgi:hypothetical protein
VDRRTLQRRGQKPDNIKPEILKSISRFFWLCSGADRDLLEKCPTEKEKYAGIGATVFFTGVFAAASAAYALYTVFDSWWVAVAAGLVWGLMIFNLDRYIVSSMRKAGSFRTELLLALPRLVLAVLISLVIAKPLELKIFSKEIEPVLRVMEQEAYAQQETAVRNRYETTRQEKLQSITRWKAEMAEKAKQRDALLLAASQEADGTGGSRKKNLGPIYKIKKADADKATEELNTLAARNLPNIREAELALMQEEKNMQAEISALVRASIDGPAARLEALDRVTQTSSAMAWANVFIVLLFILIESAPVLVKLLSPRGPYDNLLRIEEHGYVVREIETLATTSAEAKQRTQNLPPEERSYVSEKLNGQLS